MAGGKDRKKCGKYRDSEAKKASRRLCKDRESRGEISEHRALELDNNNGGGMGSQKWTTTTEQ